MPWENGKYIVNMIWGKPVVPLKVYDEVIENYYMDHDGNVYSKFNCNPKKLKPAYSLTKRTNQYPYITIRINGSKKKVRMHRLVGYTLLSFTCPQDISAKDWARTPSAVKTLIFRNAMEVNHIDEDHLNFHPSNLEWVTRKGNLDAFHNNPARFVGENYFSKETLHRKAA